MPAYLSAFLVGLLLLSPLPARAAEPTQIAVSGAGSVTLPPDEAVVRASVETNDPSNAATAMGHNEALYERVAAAIVALGIPRQDVALSYYNVNYVAPPRNGSTYQYGFTVQRSFSVRVRQIDLAGRVVDAAIANGATAINGVTFDVENATAASAQAMQRAVADATVKATALARDAGLHVVGIASITLQDAYVPERAGVAHLSMGPSSPAPPTTFDSENATVTVTVNVVFLAKP